MACRSFTPISADHATTTEENAVLTHPILDQLSQLGLAGMAQAFAELEASDETAALTHTDWLALLVDRELTHRRDKRLAARLRYARLRQQASVEDVDYRAPRGLDRALFHKLTNGEWIDAHDNLILCGPTGVGKSWLACALGHKACRDNRSVLYQRVPKLFPELALARGDGRYARILRGLTGVQLLILDDWGLEPLDVLDYLNQISWDGVPRLDTWLVAYIGTEDTEYTQAVGPRWMISGVARIYEPGCKADCVLVLEGPQGILKSSAFAAIGGAWYTNDVAALGTTAAQEQILGNWIVELDELEAVTRARDVVAVKAFVSRSIDKFRLPYGHRSHAHPRQCIFGGTTNRETWMRDETGGRRWWPVRSGLIDIDALRQDRDQLWAEARDRYLTGER